MKGDLHSPPLVSVKAPITGVRIDKQGGFMSTIYWEFPSMWWSTLMCPALIPEDSKIPFCCRIYFKKSFQNSFDMSWNSKLKNAKYAAAEHRRVPLAHAGHGECGSVLSEVYPCLKAAPGVFNHTLWDVCEDGADPPPSPGGFRPNPIYSEQGE